MQDFYTKIQQTYGKANEEAQIFLRPEQIKSKAGQKRGQSTNSIIRLAESIKRYGIIEPLSVRKSGEERGFSVFELIDGEQRLRAAALAGVAKIPCVVLPQDDKSYAIAGIIEHLRGGGLHMFEQAAGFRLLMLDFLLTQEEIAQKLGVSQSAIANKLRLLKLSHEEQQTILEYGLTERHARAILRLKEPKMRSLALRRIREEHLNVAASEEMIENLLGTSPKCAVRKGDSTQSDVSSDTVQEGATQLNALNDAVDPQRGSSLQGNFLQDGCLQGNFLQDGCLQGSFLQEDARLNTAEKGRELQQIQGKPEQNTAIFTVLSPQTPPKGCVPRKFVIPDLTPLYNSIERTLSIFRKTGASVSCMREEGADRVRIIIEIPKNA